MLNINRFHNYHHAFPGDYSGSKDGITKVYNPMTAMINLFEWLGLAWDLRKPNPDVVAMTIKAQSDQLAYRTYSPLVEWATGLLAYIGPFFAIRWILIMNAAL